jgi:hypothetical protein
LENPGCRNLPERVFGEHRQSVREGLVGDRLDTGHRQDPQRVLFAGRLDDPGQHRGPKHHVAAGCRLWWNERRGLSDDVLESVDAGRRAVIEAVRKFVSTFEEQRPALVDPARRKAFTAAGLDLADGLSTALMELPRSVRRSAGETLSGKSGGAKE